MFMHRTCFSRYNGYDYVTKVIVSRFYKKCKSYSDDYSYTMQTYLLQISQHLVTFRIFARFYIFLRKITCRSIFDYITIILKNKGFFHFWKINFICR